MPRHRAPVSGFAGQADATRGLEVAVAAAHRGEPGLVVVEGAAGMGRTTFVREFLAAATGVVAVPASGDETETGLAFGVIDQLRAALPVEPASGARADPIAVGAELLAGLRALAARHTLIVVVDDADWMDDASARALLFVARRLFAERLLLVLTTRPGGLERLDPGWHRLLRDPTVTRWLYLTGLTAADIRRLAAPAVDLPLPLARGLHEHTGGNPRHVLEVLADLPDPGGIDGYTPLPVPRSYAAAVAARVGGLPAPARDLLQAASVLGVTCSLRSAAAVGAVPEPESAAVTADGHDLIEGEPLARNGRIVFVDPLVRAAIYRRLPIDERRRLHLAAAAVVDRHAAFEHRTLAGLGAVDTGLAAELREESARQEQRGRLAEAADCAAWAAQVDANGPAADAAVFHAAELRVLAGDVHGARRLAAAVAVRPSNPHRDYALALLDLSYGDFSRATVALEAVVDAAAAAGEPHLHARASAALAHAAALAGDSSRALRLARPAASLAPWSAAARALATQALAWSHARAGRLGDALGVLSGCSPHAMVPAPFEPDLLVVRGAIRTWTGDPTGAAADLSGAARWLRLGSPVAAPCLLYSAWAEAEFRTGYWSAAAQHLDQALALASELDHGWYLAYTHAVATLLQGARGDHEAAARHADEAVRTSASSVDGAGYAALARAHQAWADADWPALVGALGDLDIGPGAGGPNLAAARLRLAEAWIHLDEPGRAARLLAGAAPVGWGGVERSDLLRLTALLHAATGDDDRADAAFGSGLAAMGAPEFRSLADGLLALDYGRVLGRTRRRRAAIAPLLVARDVFVRLGAVTLLTTTESELARSGVAVNDALRGSNPVQRLTGREQVVAHLIADGLTNREIAAELCVSVKAVEYHVGNIFTKFGVHSRRELITAVAPRSRAGGASRSGGPLLGRHPRDGVPHDAGTRPT